MPKTNEQAKKELDALSNTHEKGIERLAREMYNARVVPFCKKYNLTFRAGNGGYCFWDAEHTQVRPDHYNDEIWYGARLIEMEQIYNLLDLECANGHNLGTYIDDYTG